VEHQLHGVWRRLKLAFAAFFTILFKGRLPTALQQPEAVPVTPPGPAPPDEPDRAIQIVALLQRDGRLIDFVMEDLATYDNEQIGAAVRDVHAGCRRAIDRYFTLQPILPGQEGEPTDVGEGLDPAAIRLLGQVSGRPPFRGTLLHRGWRVSRIELPPLGAAGGRRIIAQAEVEIA
jgi:hypothetical protein